MSDHPAEQLPWAPHPASSLETPFILHLPDEGFVAVRADGTTTPLPKAPTPGQLAYTAYAALPGARRAEPWTDLPSWERQRWEAAAQAVLAQALDPRVAAQEALRTGRQASMRGAAPTPTEHTTSAAPDGLKEP